MSAAAMDFEDALLAGELPTVVSDCLEEAGRLRSAQPERAHRLLLKAQRMAPRHPAPLIALYRFYFYGHQLERARFVAEDALRLGAQWLGLPEYWQDVPARAFADTRFDPVARFYLFALKGYAYLSLRLDEIEAAAPALQLLAALDPQDGVGAGLLRQVLARRGSEQDEEALELPA